MPAKSAPAVPPEPIAVVGQHSISKLSERAVGHLTYEVGIGESGVVSLTVTGNEGGGYFSREPDPPGRTVAFLTVGSDLGLPIVEGRVVSEATELLKQ